MVSTELFGHKRIVDLWFTEISHPCISLTNNYETKVRSRSYLSIHLYNNYLLDILPLLIFNNTFYTMTLF